MPQTTKQIIDEAIAPHIEHQAQAKARLLKNQLRQANFMFGCALVVLIAFLAFVSMRMLEGKFDPTSYFALFAGVMAIVSTYRRRKEIITTMGCLR